MNLVTVEGYKIIPDEIKKRKEAAPIPAQEIHNSRDVSAVKIPSKQNYY